MEWRTNPRDFNNDFIIICWETTNTPPSWGSAFQQKVFPLPLTISPSNRDCEGFKSCPFLSSFKHALDLYSVDGHFCLIAVWSVLVGRGVLGNNQNTALISRPLHELKCHVTSCPFNLVKGYSVIVPFRDFASWAASTYGCRWQCMAQVKKKSLALLSLKTSFSVLVGFWLYSPSFPVTFL